MTNLQQRPNSSKSCEDLRTGLSTAEGGAQRSQCGTPRACTSVVGKHDCFRSFPESIAKGSSAGFSGKLARRELAKTNLHSKLAQRSEPQRNLERQTCTDKLAQTSLHSELTQRTCTDKFAQRKPVQTNLPRELAQRNLLRKLAQRTCTEKLTLKTCTENLHRETYRDKLAQTQRNLHRQTCAGKPAQRNLHRETCAGKLAQRDLHRETCTERLAQTHLHRQTCTENLNGKLTQRTCTKNLSRKYKCTKNLSRKY